jgi:hypothetical protein
VETLVSFFGDRRSDPRPTVPARPDLTPEQTALFAEACTASGVIWVRPIDEARSHLAWHVWHADAVHVVYGVGEQNLPLLSGHVEVRVPSKDDHSTLLVVVARAQVLAPDSPAWQDAVTALAAARLNTLDPATAAERWAVGCLVSRLEPITVLAAGPGPRDAPDAAEPPPGNPGTTTVRRPWHLGGRSRTR